MVATVKTLEKAQEMLPTFSESGEYQTVLAAVRESIESDAPVAIRMWNEQTAQALINRYWGEVASFLNQARPNSLTLALSEDSASAQWWTAMHGVAQALMYCGYELLG